jgi:hypothetical protein
MARTPADPVLKARKILAACTFGETSAEFIPKKKKVDHEEHLRKYRTTIPIIRELVPQPDLALDTACERLGIPRDTIHGFIVSSGEMSATIFPNLQNGHASIEITSAVVERLTVDELIYIFGHELGHYIFPYEYQRDAAHRAASLEDASISRTGEICMDRVGLAACRDINAACSAALKMQSGLGSQHLICDVGTYGKEAVKGYKLDPTFSDLISTHPQLFLRIRAAMLFAQSDAYLDLVGGKGGRPIAEVNAEIRTDLYNTTDFHAEKKRAEFLAVLPCHFVAWAVSMGQDLKDLDLPVVTGQPDTGKIKGFLENLAEIPAEKREEAISSMLANLAQKATVICPRQAFTYVEEVVKKTDGTKLHPVMVAFRTHLEQAKHVHLNQKSFLEG